MKDSERVLPAGVISLAMATNYSSLPIGPLLAKFEGGFANGCNTTCPSAFVAFDHRRSSSSSSSCRPTSSVTPLACRVSKRLSIVHAVTRRILRRRHPTGPQRCIHLANRSADFSRRAFADVRKAGSCLPCG